MPGAFDDLIPGSGGGTAVATPPDDGLGSFADLVPAKTTYDPGKIMSAAQSCPPGEDCSAFAQSVAGKMGHKLPRTAIQQYGATTRVLGPDATDYSNLQPGDLVFFDNGMRDAYNTAGKKDKSTGAYVNHVGMYIGGGKFIADPGQHSDDRTPKDLGTYVSAMRERGGRFVGAGRFADAVANAPDDGTGAFGDLVPQTSAQAKTPSVGGAITDMAKLVDAHEPGIFQSLSNVGDAVGGTLERTAESTGNPFMDAWHGLGDYHREPAAPMEYTAPIGNFPASSRPKQISPAAGDEMVIGGVYHDGARPGEGGMVHGDARGTGNVVPGAKPGTREWYDQPLWTRLFSGHATDADHRELMNRVDPMTLTTAQLDQLNKVDPKAADMLFQARQTKLEHPDADLSTFMASNMGQAATTNTGRVIPGITPDQMGDRRVAEKAANHHRKVQAVLDLNSGRWDHLNLGDLAAAINDTSGAHFTLGATSALVSDIPNAAVHLALNTVGSGGFTPEQQKSFEEAVHKSPAAQFLPFLIPGVGHAAMMAQAGNALSESAEQRSFEPITKFAQGLVESANVFDPSISIEERLTRVANGLFLALGAAHGMAGMERSAAIERVATTLGGGEIPGGERGQAIREQAGQMVDMGAEARHNLNQLNRAAGAPKEGGRGVDQKVADAEKFGAQDQWQTAEARRADVGSMQANRDATLESLRSTMPELVPPPREEAIKALPKPTMPAGAPPEPRSGDTSLISTARMAERPYDFERLAKTFEQAHPSITPQMATDLADTWKQAAQAWTVDSGGTVDEYMRRFAPEAAKFDPSLQPAEGAGKQATADQGIVKGQVTFPQGYGVDPKAGRAVIQLFEHGDVSTLLHESAHIWRRTLDGENRAILEKWLKVEGGNWTQAHEERFARAVERYFMTGRAPNAELQGVFARFKQWMKRIYHSLKTSPELDMNVPAPVRDVLDRTFSAEKAAAPRARDLAERAKFRESLAGLDPEDPRLDPFHEAHDPDLYHAVRDELGGPHVGDRTASEVLQHIHEKLDRETLVRDQAEAIDHSSLELLREEATGVKGGNLDVWERKNGKWSRRPQRVATVDASNFPDYLRDDLLRFARDSYIDSDHYVFKHTSTKEWDNGISRPPKGALRMSEYALKESDPGEGLGGGSGKNQIPRPIVQAYLEHLDPGKPRNLHDLIDETHSDFSYGHQGIDNVQMSAETPEARAKRLAQMDLDARAQREIFEKSRAGNDAKAAAERQARIDSGQETLIEKRARLAAEKLAARSTPATDTLFQRTGTLSADDHDLYADLAAPELQRGRDRRRVVQWLANKAKVSIDEAKGIVKTAERRIRLEQDQTNEAKAYDRIQELHNQGLRSKDIIAKLKPEFPDIKATRWQKAWREGLAAGGLDPHGSGPVLRMTRELEFEKNLKAAKDDIIDLQKSGASFTEISDMLGEKYPDIPKSRRQEAFAEALKRWGANEKDSEGNLLPVVTRLNDAGDLLVTMSGKSVTVPEAIVRNMANIVGRLGHTRSFFLTESKMLDLLDPTNGALRKWLVENRENAVTSMMTEREAWKQRLRDEVPIALHRKTSELLMKFGEGVIGLDELKAERPNDWQDIVKAEAWFRDRYDELLDRVNRVRRKYGMEEIPRRANYFTHFQEESKWSPIVDRILGAHGGVASEAFTPDAPAGGGDYARNSPFNKFALRRLGKKTTYDALQAFETYLTPTLAQIHMTKSVMRHSAMAQVLMRKAGELEEGTDTHIPEHSELQAADSLKVFANRVKDYQRVLAGQKTEWDVAMDKSPLRVPMQLARVLSRRVGAAKIVAKLSTALMQTVTAKHMLSDYGVGTSGLALLKNLGEMAGKGNVLEESPFLQRRYADVTSARTTWRDIVRGVATYPMNAVEEFMGEWVWRGAYERAIGKNKALGGQGLDHEEAIKYADRMAEDILAGRALGEKPIAFESGYGKVFLQFMLEKSNDFQRLGMLGEMNGKKLTRSQAYLRTVKLAIGIYAVNELMQAMKNDRPEAGDVIQLIKDELQIGGGTAPAKKKAAMGAGRVVGEGLSLIPGGTMLSGLLPKQNVFGTGLTNKELLGKTEAGQFSGSNAIVSTVQDAGSGDMMANLLRDFILPYGGAQVTQTLRGADAIEHGQLHKKLSKVPVVGAMLGGLTDSHVLEKQSGKVRYQVKGAADKTRALMFGPNATDGAENLREKNYQKALKPNIFHRKPPAKG